MTHRARLSLVLSLILITSLQAQSQPRGGGGRGGFGGGMSRGGTADQVFSIVAFEEKFEVTDEQLVKLRAGLKPTYAKQREMMEEMFSGDGNFESMRESMIALREETMQTMSEVLSDEQMTKLQEHMEEMRSRRGRFGGGRGGRGAQRNRGGGGS